MARAPDGFFPPSAGYRDEKKRLRAVLERVEPTGKR